MALLGVGIGLVGLFTASIASILIERHLRRRELVATNMEPLNIPIRRTDGLREGYKNPGGCLKSS